MPDQAKLPGARWPVAVIAHRGGAGISPENTLAAYRKAIDLSADYVEIDVRTTKDGVLVIMHDSTVDRTTDGHGKVRDLTLAEIRRLKVADRFDKRSAGERVPTLDEVLALCRSKISINLDHKDADTAVVLQALKAHDMVGRVLVYNRPGDLKEWKRLAPDIPVMPSLPGEFRRPGGVAAFLKDNPVEALDGHLLEWTPELVSDAHAAGVKVYVDIMGPTDNPDGYARALGMRVEGIQTDYPDRLLRYLRQQRARGAR